MFSISIEVHVSVMVSSSATATSKLPLRDFKERRIKTVMEPMDCEMREATDKEWINEDEKFKPFGHRMDCSDNQCGHSTSENIRTETVTPMEVDSEH